MVEVTEAPMRMGNTPLTPEQEKAYAALRKACREGVLREVSEHELEMPAKYLSYDDFVKKHVDKTHSEIDYPPHVAAEVRRRLESHMTAEGAKFMRPMRVNLLQR